jgi:hypothetical protein
VCKSVIAEPKTIIKIVNGSSKPMDEVRFQEMFKKLVEPTGPHGTWESPIFTTKDYETMSPSQLSKVVLEMTKFTSVGSYWLRSDIFDLVNYLDRTVSIREDKTLEKYLHMTASLVCLAQFQGFPFDKVFPEEFERLRKHLERVIGPSTINDGFLRIFSNETEPSIQIATFLAYPLLEGIVRRKLSRFIAPDGTVLCEFKVIEGKKTYRRGERVSSLHHELQLLERETLSFSLKAILTDNNKIQPLFEEIREYRNMLLHGELTASWHSLTLLLLTYLILLEG